MAKIIQNILCELLFIFFSALGLIPRRWSVSLAYALGDIWYLIDKRHRVIALENLRHAFSHEKSREEMKRITRGVFRNFALIPFEIGWSLRITLSDFMRHCEVIGKSNLMKAHSKGKGVLVLTAHVGNWELMPNIIRSYGLHASFVYRPLDFEPADLFLYEYRSRYGCIPIPKKNSMRKIIKSLKNQLCVGILLDQDARRKAGIFTEFFGRPACTNTGLALMALKTGAPVITAFIVRHGMGFKMIFGQEIPLVHSGQRAADIHLNTLQYNQAIEAFVREYPDQWLWVHRRWKTKPLQR
jgi:KDO2-lipid IV(A) lauroyltransferase